MGDISEINHFLAVVWRFLIFNFDIITQANNTEDGCVSSEILYKV